MNEQICWMKILFCYVEEHKSFILNPKE